MRPKCPEDEFIELCRTKGPQGTADELGQNIRNVHSRLRRIEKRRGITIVGPNFKNAPVKPLFPGRLYTKVYDGIVMIGSDHHYWPGEPSTAHKAFCKLAKKLRPKVVIANGDVLDFGQISRHLPIGWESQPTVHDEILAAQARLKELERAAPNAERFWPLGNHDARFESKIAHVAPEYARVHGVHLQDHFEGNWQPCWSVWINDGMDVLPVVVKHRIRGGVHARHNNTVNAGTHTVTGHLHNLGATPFSDLLGTRFGIDTGTMAEPYSEQFLYLEDGPRNWRSGFVVLTFRQGRLMWPEFCHVIEPGLAEFRGGLIEV